MATELLIFVLLIALGFSAGTLAEKRHFRSLGEREHHLRHQLVVADKLSYPDLAVAHAELAVGSVVVSVDYFKRFLAGIRMLMGGELHSYSTLVERGRREAVLRMKEACPGADLFVNARVQTATISSGQGQAVGCVEVIAYATALTLSGAGRSASQDRLDRPGALG